MRRKRTRNISNYLVPALGLAVLAFAMSSVADSQKNRPTPDYNMLQHNYILAQHEVDVINEKYQAELSPAEERRDIALCLLGQHKVQNGLQTELTYQTIEAKCNDIKKNFAQ